MVTTIIASLIAFATTNVDDIFILMALFSQVRASAGLTGRQVVMGQYLGFAAIVALSMIGALSSFFIPVPWIGLLGLVPIYMGVTGLWSLRGDASVEQGREVVSTGSALTVAAITFGNGGDNIAIYIPMFASQSFSGNLLTLLIFFVMLAVWCFLGYKLVRAPGIATVLEKNGHILVPIVLVVLGLFILYHSGSFGLLSF